MEIENTTGRTALLVIDVQVAMFEGPDLPHQSDLLIPTIAQVIDRARAANVPVIYVQHDHATYEPMKPGQPGWAIHPAIAPHPGELVVNKQASDSFYETSLQTELQQRGIDHLVVAGMQTEACVDTTCRSAISHDYNVTLVADGHSTWDTDHISAAPTHRPKPTPPLQTSPTRNTRSPPNQQPKSLLRKG